VIVGGASAIVQARDVQGGVHIYPVPPTLVQGQVVVGLIPHEPPNFQTPDQVITLAGLSGEVCVVCAVTGQRGVGKSQVAAAYARQRVRDGWLVAWIGSESADSIKAGVAALADRLHLHNSEDDAETAAARIRDHLQTRSAPALLVFDNLADLDAITPYLPAAGPTQVVITSTVRGAERTGRPVPVDVFDEATALRFLRQATGLHDDGARTLATALGFLPLALAQAAARIRAGWDYPTYLDHFRRYPVERYLTRRAGEQYPLGAAGAILIALEPFYPSDLLDTLAVFSPDGVSRDILAADDRIDDELEKLYEASIVEFVGDSTRVVTMHRLVQRIIRDRSCHTGTYLQVLSRQADHLAGMTFSATEAWRLKQRGDELVRQIDALWENSTNQTVSIFLDSILRMRVWGVRHLIATAALARAIPLARNVVSDVKAFFGEDHELTLTAAETLAKAYESAGRVGEAITLYEQILADRRRLLGEDHPSVLTSANNLACAYQSAGRLDEATPLLEQILTHMQRVLGEDHPHTLATANNLANTYQSAGSLSEATRLHEQTLTGRRRALGKEHPSTLTSANNLAYAYKAAGRLSEAIPLYEQTLVAARRVLSEDHPDTLGSASNLADAYHSVGRLDEAVQLHEQTLTVVRRVLGENHPNILTTASGLAGAYASAGRLDEAISLYEQTLVAARKVLGEAHPNTLKLANNVAHAYGSAGRKNEAIWLLQDALTVMRGVLGEDHPDTLAAANNLAHAFAVAGRIGEAIELNEWALTTATGILDEDHPLIAIIRSNLRTYRKFQR
jgi:tetratricopeptide (TPR) repeat protein